MRVAAPCDNLCDSGFDQRVRARRRLAVVRARLEGDVQRRPARAPARPFEGHGFRVRLAPSGALALDSVAAERPDVVVLDLAMPGMSGAEVCRRLRAWSQIPILVLSAKSDELAKVRALEAGADDYVTKPFGARELVARIRAALRREQARREDAPVVRVGELEVDFSAHRVRIGGKEISLTPKQYEVLAYLARNAGKLLTHRQILQTVWGNEYGEESDYIWTYVRRLRRKIEPDPEHPRYLLTEPGAGYRLAAAG
jgi:two-component system KDP operon response regulator KdpE